MHSTGEFSHGGGKTLKILMVYPRTPDTFWSLKHALRFISKRSAFPPLGLLTVAAMLPRAWHVKLVDENVETLRDADLRWADYVMVSAMVLHLEPVKTIVRRCHDMGKQVIGGGPLFTAGADVAGDGVHCVVGEAENVIQALIADMRQGRLRPIYQSAQRPEISEAPIPRWDLIKLKNYATMAVQFSRGCPYDCEFCDIIVVSGRRPRTKAPRQILAELESLQRSGWRDAVFVVDDNFIGNKARVKEFLRELIAWRRRTGSRLEFLTEASVNLADDPELLDLMVAAGFTRVFLGIETPHTASLKECHKHQNLQHDLATSVRTIQRAGIEVMGGFIVGFDNDPAHVFDMQFDFIQRSGIVTAMVGLLTALPQTALYQRLVKEGRLLTHSTGNNTNAVLNFEPKLGREFLLGGYRSLMQALYEPDCYYQRVLTFLAECPRLRPWRRRRLRLSDLRAFIKSLWLLGFRYRGRWAYWKYLAMVFRQNARQIPLAISLAIKGHHFRTIANEL